MYGNLINRYTKFADAINPTKHSLDNFNKGRMSYQINFRECNNKNTVEHNFSSIIPYSYDGNGHVRVKGDFLKNKTNFIKKINIYEITKN